MTFLALTCLYPFLKFFTYPLLFLKRRFKMQISPNDFQSSSIDSILGSLLPITLEVASLLGCNAPAERTQLNLVGD